MLIVTVLVISGTQCIWLPHLNHWRQRGAHSVHFFSNYFMHFSRKMAKIIGADWALPPRLGNPVHVIETTFVCQLSNFDNSTAINKIFDHAEMVKY